MGTPTLPHTLKLGWDSVTPVTKAIEYRAGGLAASIGHIDPGLMRGTRSRDAANVTGGLVGVGGNVALVPSVAELDYLLPYILGGTKSSTTYPLTETLPSAYVVQDKGPKVATYAGVKVARAILSSSSRSPQLALELELLGLTEVLGSAGTFPSGATLLAAGQPFVHFASTVTIGGTARTVDDIAITIDNGLESNRYFNSQTRTALPEGDRAITLGCVCPFTSDEIDLYGPAIAGLSASVAYTNGTNVLTFTFAALQIPTQPVVVGQRGEEVLMRLEGVARQSGATKELVTTMT